MQNRVLIVNYPWEQYFNEVDEYFRITNEGRDEDDQDTYLTSRKLNKLDIVNALNSFVSLDNVEDSFYSTLEFIDYNYGSCKIVDLNIIADLDRYLLRYPVLAFLNYIPMMVGLILKEDIDLGHLNFGKLVHTEESIIVEVTLNG